MKTIIKIIIIGITTTIFRILGQLLIPAGTQDVLQPSIFVLNGTMPIAFTIYGVFAYSLIAALFLLVRNNLSGNRIIQGVEFGLSCCVIWVVYLFEPLPHVIPIDRLTYPVVDGAVLLIMGILLGLLLGIPTKNAKRKLLPQRPVIPVIAITALFLCGRFVQYLVFNIYSSFDDKTIETFVWNIFTGAIIACSLTWFNQYIDAKNRIIQFCLLGFLFYGVNLTLFNFFMPLVFQADIPDLVIRTTIDIIMVTIGSSFFGQIRQKSVSKVK